MASGINHEARIQKTLEELCVADLVPNYCTSCSSGQGCCAQCSDDSSSEEILLTSKTVYTSSRTDKASYCAINQIKDMDNYYEDIKEKQERIFDDRKDRYRNEVEDDRADDSTIDQSLDDRSTFIHFDDSYVDQMSYEPELNIDRPLDDQDHIDYSSFHHKPIRQRHLKIDLSNEDDVSDREILKRLLSPTENYYGDQPLEVILEIVGEEDEIDNGYSIPAVEKSFQSLSEKLKDSSLFTVTLEEDDFGTKSSLDDTADTLADDYTPPSYEKANALMTEIENCFIETAQIVERTLGGNKNPLKNVDFRRSSCELPSSPSEAEKKRQKLSKTVQEALDVFDSIISDHKAKHQYSSRCLTDGDDSSHYILNQGVNDDNIASTSNDNSGPRALGNHFWRRYRYSFDKDVDELFHQCYELSAVEPSDSLMSCLKNLENLCIQLRKAKDHILKEIAEHKDEPSDIINEDKLALINELLERKLKSKLKIEKFTVVPPVMGLEGKTHKIIAEVSPKNYDFEIGFSSKEENGHMMNNSSIFEQEHDYVNIPSYNYLPSNLTDYQDSAFDSNSDMSVTTTNCDSNSSGSMSRNLLQTTSDENGYQQSIADSIEEDRNAILSYEDSIALYEDNQELQDSLLSILHSLNDIHNNFLKRRKIESSLVRESSFNLQNDIRASLHDEDYYRHYITPSQLTSTSETFENKLSDNNRISLVEKISDDFESIEDIIKVSEELKNLWLDHSENVISPKKLRQKPSRSMSLGRNYRHRRYIRSRHSVYSSEDESSSCTSGHDYNIGAESMESMNLNTDMSCSMPNLNMDAIPTPDGSTSPMTDISQAELVDHFNLQMKQENEKCYEVTMNFLKRMMEACQVIDGEPTPPTNKLPQHLLDSTLLKQIKNQREDVVDNQRENRRSLYDFNAYMRTC